MSEVPLYVNFMYDSPKAVPGLRGSSWARYPFRVRAVGVVSVWKRKNGCFPGRETAGYGVSGEPGVSGNGNSWMWRF